MVIIQEYTKQFQEQVKNFVIKAHEEFKFSYDYNLDYDLENPQKVYIDTGGTFLLLFENQELIGTIALKASAKSDKAEMKRFYVMKEYRGKKYGLLLFNEILKIAKGNDIRELILDTNTIQKQAVSFYEKNGFELIQQKGNKLFMKKILN